MLSAANERPLGTKVRTEPELVTHTQTRIPDRLASRAAVPYPAELHTDGALPPFSRASSPQKLASPTFQVPFWYTATPD